MCAKRNVKSEILVKSLDLFNRNSWSQTSLRKIAVELDISDGNLRYYYKTKEEVVLSLFHQMAEEMSSFIETFEDMSLSELTNGFRNIFQIIYKYRFLFLESVFIKSAYASYAILFDQLQQSRKILFISEFERLKKQNILSSDFSEAQYEILFEQLFIISDNWIKYIDTDSDQTYVDERIFHYSNLCFGLFVPYLVSKN